MVSILPDGSWLLGSSGGKPRGLILGPILLLISLIFSLSFCCYADDLQLFVPSKANLND